MKSGKNTITTKANTRKRPIQEPTTDGMGVLAALMGVVAALLLIVTISKIVNHNACIDKEASLGCSALDGSRF